MTGWLSECVATEAKRLCRNMIRLMVRTWQPMEATPQLPTILLGRNFHWKLLKSSMMQAPGNLFAQSNNGEITGLAVSKLVAL